MSDRSYPTAAIEVGTRPPVRFTDRAGRQIAIRQVTDADTAVAALRAMYVAFDPVDRAQGIPPSEPAQITAWLERIITTDAVNVIAWDGDRAVGHATLVPDGDASELAIFVLQSHQEAGIGTRLLSALLGAGAAAGIERVWLSVERWNHAALALYEKVGFEVCETAGFEIEMSLRLPASDADDGL